MQLELFKTLPKLAEEKLHSKYKLLRDNITISGAKEILQEWSDGFIDRDNKIVEEFQTSYHSAFWELYIHAVLKEIGMVNMSYDRPDFLVKTKTCPEIVVEATTANIKTGGAQECTREPYDIYKVLFEPVFLRSDFDEVVREAIIRHANAFDAKSKKYENEYKKLPHVGENHPFVIALGAFDQIDYGQESFYPIIALLYKRFYDPKDDSYYHKEFVLKDNSSPIELGLFCNDKFKHISAVMFSCVVTHGKLCALAISQQKTLLWPQQIFTIRHDFDFPHFKLQLLSSQSQETLTEGLWVFHNPYAEHPIPNDVFRQTDAIQVYLEPNGLRFEGNSLPIIARCNSAIPLPVEFVLPRMHKAYNPGYISDIFVVEEIDEQMDPPEMTLVALEGDYCRIIDLTKENIVSLREKEIQVRDCVAAQLDSRDPGNVILLEIEKISMESHEE